MKIFFAIIFVLLISQLDIRIFARRQRSRLSITHALDVLRDRLWTAVRGQDGGETGGHEQSGRVGDQRHGHEAGLLDIG